MVDDTERKKSIQVIQNRTRKWIQGVKVFASHAANPSKKSGPLKPLVVTSEQEWNIGPEHCCVFKKTQQFKIVATAELSYETQ